MGQILLTGATGFLGSHLLEAFLKEGHQVTATKRRNSNMWRIESMLPHCEIVNINEIPVEKLMRQSQFDAVIHTVCDYGRQGHSAFEITRTNLMLGLELLDAAVNNGVNTFINTDSLLSPDVNAYALSKHQFVDWLKFYSNRIQVINLRLEHMYGPKDDPTKFVSWLLTQFKTKVKRIPLTEGYQKRDFVFITDVVNAYKTTFNASSELTEYTDFDVGSGSLTSVREFVTALKDAYRAIDSECETELGFGDSPMRNNEKSEVKVDLSALHRLNWQNTTTLNEGLKKLLREYK